jgi:hypothetical protein
MFGAQTNSDSNYETQTNQARLEYYTDNTSRKKMIEVTATNYWLGSRSTEEGNANFCAIDTSGASSTAAANANNIGYAPAFCIGYEPAP